MGQVTLSDVRSIHKIAQLLIEILNSWLSLVREILLCPLFPDRLQCIMGEGIASTGSAKCAVTTDPSVGQTFICLEVHEWGVGVILKKF